MAALYRINFQTANNEDLRQAFVMTDSAQAPFDLTGASLRMDLDAFNGTDVLEATTSNGRIVIHNAAAGQFELAVPAATMRTVPPGSYQHDLLLTFADGRVHRVWTGTLTLSPGVTE
jgi:hypothetical protein